MFFTVQKLFHSVINITYFYFSDLDEDIQSGDKNLDDILPRDHVQSNFPSNFNSFGSFSSSSVTHDSNGVSSCAGTV